MNYPASIFFKKKQHWRKEYNQLHKAYITGFDIQSGESRIPLLVAN